MLILHIVGIRSWKINRNIFFAGGGNLNIFFAGDYTFDTCPEKLDIGFFANRLLSYDYQKKYIDKFLKISKKVKENEENPMQLFLAGAGNFADDSKNNLNYLFSYFNDKGRLRKGTPKNNKVIVDSGAFSAWTKGITLDVDEYISWINERSEDIYLFGQIDSIPGTRTGYGKGKTPKQAASETWDNYLYMRRFLKNPDSLLYTFRVGEPFEFMQKACNYKDERGRPIPYIALGGMVGKPYTVRDNFLRKCFSVIRNSDNPNVSVHAFGMTDFSLCEKYPITSADSTSWIMVGAMGNIMTNFGTVNISSRGESSVRNYKNLTPSEKKVIQDSCNSFGLNAEDMRDSIDLRILYNALYMTKKAEEISCCKSINTFKTLF